MDSLNAKPEKKENPRASANIFSALTFSWTLPLFRKGFKRDLTINDLPAPLNEHTSSRLGDKLEKAWDQEVLRAKRKNKEPSLLAVIVRLFGLKMLSYGILVFFNEVVLRIAQPMLLGGMILYFTQEGGRTEVTKEAAYMYASGLIACTGLYSNLLHPYLMACLHNSMKLRVGACSLIYRKALKLSKTMAHQTTAGQVVNLISNDVSRFDLTFLFIHHLWVGPVQTLVVTYFLWDFFNVSALFGLAALLIFIPYHGWLGKRSSMIRLKTAVRTDERVKLMNEIITGIQVIKMYAWEKPFAKLIDGARRKEVKELKKNAYIKGILLSFVNYHTRIAVFVTIVTYLLRGNSIDPVKIYVLFSFYNTLRENMTEFFPLAILSTAESLISVKRIRDFLMISEDFPKKLLNNLKEEKPESNGLKPVSSHHYNHVIGKVDNHGIFIKNASAKWLESSDENTLSNLTFDVTSGCLTAVIGPVGSGKTSLFHAILRELPLTSGSIEVRGEISYSSQEPWLFHGSVRQNILFGLSYNRDRYRKVVKVCSLKTDFEQLPYGDKTIVGERGVSLSGGQRARINLARAVYKEADVYILDDPLSAVDTHVGKHLFEECIQGYLKEKAVILVTHQLQYLEDADQIVLLDNGKVSALGEYETLRKSGLSFAKLMSQESEQPKPVALPLASESSIQLKQPVQTFGSLKSIQSVASSCYDESNIDNPTEVAEIQSSGRVGGKVYKQYFIAEAGKARFFFILIMCLIAQAFISGSDSWIAYWVNLEQYFYKTESSSLNSNETRSSNETSTRRANSNYYVLPREYCIYVYAGITLGTIIFPCIRSLMLFQMCMRSSIRLHNKMFYSISRAKMWFFNNNTSGRILNRFSKDIGTMDELLPSAVVDVAQLALDVIAILIIVATVIPLILIPTFVITFICFLLSRFYVTTSRSIKRLEGVTKSPVFSHMNATIQGLTTIRAFRAEKVLIQEFDNHQDVHSSAWYLFLATNRALAYWLDMMCVSYITAVAFSFLVLGGDYFGGDIGLAITQAIGLMGVLQWVIRQISEAENQMTAVERVLEYSCLESEPPLESPPDKRPKDSWPEEGKIEFSKVHLRYSSNEPWVLKDLNFTILPQQKIGVVGRTGAGKSSLISALFRLTEVDGAIIIDGVDAMTIGLHELRSKISIIPQEPVLFSGSLRKNLDPFDEHNDEVLWNALEEVELKNVVKELPGGLQVEISEGGSNLSLGQRQLVCLARAIIKNNKILVLDEATANVDIQTDVFIQQAIRRKFRSCTIITVAHRLNTVMDSDKILVMDGGVMVEFDHPHILLQNKNGFLYRMVQQSGKGNEETLTQLAAENYRMTNSNEDL